MPRKSVDRRAPSPIARCERRVLLSLTESGVTCGHPLVFETGQLTVIEVCVAGHLHSMRAAVPERWEWYAGNGEGL